MAEPALSMAGLILAGGRSSRFGSEKAMATLAGRTMLDSIAERFARQTRTAVSVRPGSGAERWARAHGFETVYDDPRLASGPLAGLASGMVWAQRSGFDCIATAPCDAPLLPRTLFATLHERLGRAGIAYAVTDAGPHPLCALWRTALLPALKAVLADGRHPSVRSLLLELGAKPVGFADERAFANANTPAALAALEVKA